MRLQTKKLRLKFRKKQKNAKPHSHLLNVVFQWGAEVVLQNHPEVVAVVKMIGKLSIRAKPIRFSELAQKTCRPPLRGKGGALALSGKKTARYSSGTRRSRFV